MSEADSAVETTVRVLRKCSSGFTEVAPWSWRLEAQNGSLVALEATVEDGFLHLATRPNGQRWGERDLGRALEENHTLAGGVKFALAPASRVFHLRSEIPLSSEARMLDRVHRALMGFHQGCERLEAPDGVGADAAPTPADAPVTTDLGDLLRETSWASAERGPNDFAVDLGLDSAPPARASATALGVEVRVDLARLGAAAEAAPRALAVFLLTASSTLRMVRAHAQEAEEKVFGFEVCLAEPAAEELDDALAALAIAHRMCAREANVLLDEAAARCYLAVRNVPLISNPANEKEN